MFTRFTKTFIAVIVFLFLLTSLFVVRSPGRTYWDPVTGNIFGEGGVEQDLHSPSFGTKETFHGSVIMPKLGNETAKAALGQATWKLMHTMTLRYPEEPTEDERAALESYFHLQARLYPCGECAAEFQQLLKKFPPQTSSRKTAALWLCHVHNQVNERLRKPEFDCAHLDDTYDCGCGDDPIGLPRDENSSPSNESRDPETGAALIRGGK